MKRTSFLTRNLALAGTVALMLSGSAFAQYPGQYQRVAARNYANRTVEGTVASVMHANNGDHVRLTNGMDLLVPNNILATRGNRRYGANTLLPGDVVRMSVYSRQGDGRDARVQSFEILQTGARGIGVNPNVMYGTVVSVDRRANTIVMRADNGSLMTLDVNTWNGRNGRANSFRRGDRVSFSGRTNRNGAIIVDDIRLSERR